MAPHRSWPAALQQVARCRWGRPLHEGSPKAHGLLSLLSGVVIFSVFRAVVQLTTSVCVVEAATPEINQASGQAAAAPATWKPSEDSTEVDQGETPECEDMTALECAKRNAERKRKKRQSPSGWWQAPQKSEDAARAPLPGAAAPSEQELLEADTVSAPDFAEDNANWLPDRETPHHRPLSASETLHEKQLISGDERAVTDNGPGEERISPIGDDVRFPAGFSETESTGQSDLSQEDFTVPQRPPQDESQFELYSADDDEAAQGEGAYWAAGGPSRSADNNQVWGAEKGEEASGAARNAEGNDGYLAQAEVGRREKPLGSGTAAGPVEGERRPKRPLGGAEDVGVAREVPWEGGPTFAVSGFPRNKLSELKLRVRGREEDSPSRRRRWLRWVLPIASTAALLAGAGFGARAWLGGRRRKGRV